MCSRAAAGTWRLTFCLFNDTPPPTTDGGPVSYYGVRNWRGNGGRVWTGAIGRCFDQPCIVATCFITWWRMRSRTCAWRRTPGRAANVFHLPFSKISRYVCARLCECLMCVCLCVFVVVAVCVCGGGAGRALGVRGTWTAGRVTAGVDEWWWCVSSLCVLCVVCMAWIVVGRPLLFMGRETSMRIGNRGWVAE